MAQVYNRLTLDVKKKNHDIITAVQKDTASRFLDINLVDNGVNINLSGHRVRIYAKKPDGTEVYNDGQITNAAQGRVQIELTSQLLAKEGYIEAQIITYRNNLQILSTLPFKIFVVSSLMSDSSVESSNEYGALVVLYQKLYEALELMRSMVEKIGTPGQVAQENNLDTMFKLWEYIITYMKQNSTEGISEKIGLPSDTTANTLFGAIKHVPAYGGFQVFISNGTFKVPPGVTQIRVTGCAAGGDGASGTAGKGGAGGKAGEGVIGKIINVTPGETLSVTCGAGNTVLGNKLTLLANNWAESVPTKLEILSGVETGIKGKEVRERDGGHGHSGYFGFGGGGGGSSSYYREAQYSTGSGAGGGGGAGGYGAGGGGGGGSISGQSSTKPGNGGKGYTGQGGTGGRDSSYPNRRGGTGGRGNAFGSGGGGGGGATTHWYGNSGEEGLGISKGNGGGGGRYDRQESDRIGGNGEDAKNLPTMPFGGVPGQGFLYIEW